MNPQRRPAGVTGLSVFFAAGALISFTSGVALSFPGGFFEPMWRLNPRARDGFASMGGWAVLLMTAVCVACAFSALGLWRGTRWGHKLAFGVLLVNMVGDILNVIFMTEPRAAVGIPIVAALLFFLMSKPVRLYFNEPATP